MVFLSQARVWLSRANSRSARWMITPISWSRLPKNVLEATEKSIEFFARIAHSFILGRWTPNRLCLLWCAILKIHFSTKIPTFFFNLARTMGNTVFLFVQFFVVVVVHLVVKSCCAAVSEGVLAQRVIIDEHLFLLLCVPSLLYVEWIDHVFVGNGQKHASTRKRCELATRPARSRSRKFIKPDSAQFNRFIFDGNSTRKKTTTTTTTNADPPAKLNNRQFGS